MDNKILHAIYEKAVDTIITIDEKGLIQSSNPATERMFGYKESELQGKNVNILMPNPYRAEHDSYLANYKRTGTKKIIGIGREVVGLKKDGTTFSVHLAVSEIQLTDKKIFVGVVRDTSDMKATQNELAQSNKDLEQFAYVASHDLQEPLRMVSNFTDLLARRYKGKFDKDADEFIEFILDGSRRMRSLVEDLLAFSRVGSRGKALEYINSEAVFKNTLSQLSLAIEQSSAEITFDKLPMVLADDTQMGQVFQNLLSNAIKFHSDQPLKIHVSAKKSEDQWVFSVKDNGLGIDPEHFDRIFLMFQRLHGKDEYPGTGIGLAVCKRIIDRHGGKIWIESDKGKGSTFYFSLPAVEPNE